MTPSLPHTRPDLLRVHPTLPPITALQGPDGSVLRDVFRSAIAGAASASIAVTRVRLDTLGSLPVEMSRLRETRLLLGELRASTLDAEAHGLAVRPEGRRRLEELGDLLGSGRMELRAAPLGAWSPDFSVFDGSPARALVGSHAFGRGGPGDGPLWMVDLTERASVQRLQATFDELWLRAHDVTPAVRTIVRRALRWAPVERVGSPVPRLAGESVVSGDRRVSPRIR